MKKGPLVRVELQPGRFVKMHEADAVEQGLIEPKKKSRPKPNDKQRLPQKDKASSTPTPEEEQPEQQADDFTIIDGVGPATARALAAHGITTFADLKATENFDFLGAKTAEAITEWIEANGTD